MAFVYRKEKQQIDKAKTPGPGEYETLKQGGFTNTAVSFFDKAPRKLWETSTTPGPGQYRLVNQTPQIDGQNVLFGKAQYGFSLTENFFTKPGGCRSNFKSKSKRMIQNHNNNPGPGQYQLIKQNVKFKEETRVASSKKATKLTKYLYQQTRKQNKSPSYDYSVNASQNGYAQQSESSPHPVIKQSIIHANEKEIQSKNIYGCIFNSKVKRQIHLSRPQTSMGIGPGSYNIAQSYSSIDKKSHNHRNNPLISQSTLKQLTNFNTTQDIGPGYYKIDHSCFKRPQTSQSKGIACFGSKQSRFTNQKSKYSSPKTVPGPHTYFQTQKKSKDDNMQKSPKKAPFNSTAKKNSEQTPFLNHNQISPFSYRPKNDFNQLLKKNYIKGTIGKFGSTVQRFKSMSNTQISSRQKKFKQKNFQTLKCGQFQNKQNKLKKCTSFIKNLKKNKKKQLKRQKSEIFDERPLCYDTNSNTITSKFCKKQQKQAPFMTASQRFATKVIDKNQQVLNQIRLQQQKKNISVKGSGEKENRKNNFLNKSSNKKSVMNKYFQNIKKITITQKKDEVVDKQNPIGPQTYYPNSFPKKKSYNVLFRQQNKNLV